MLCRTMDLSIYVFKLMLLLLLLDIEMSICTNTILSR